MERSLLVHTDGAVLWFEFNRPKKKNAINQEVYDLLFDALDKGKKEGNIKLVVFTGRGDYFSSGNDFSQKPSAKIKPEDQPFNRFVKLLIDFPKPLIALVNGPAVGMAVTILGLFDLVIASDNASFWTPFPQLGLCAEGCSSFTFPLIMGHSKATQLLMFGEPMSGRDALQCGLVSRLYAHHTFATAATDLVNKLAKYPSASLLATKSLLRSRLRPHLHSTNQREQEQLRTLMFSPEAQALLAAKFRPKSKL